MRVTASRIASVCVGAWALAWSLGLSAQAGAPGQMTAFVVAGEADSERVYVAGTNRAIYEMPLPAGEGRVPLDGARRIYESPQFKQIIGLAIRRDNVLLCDTALPAVFELEPRTQKLSLVLWGSPLKAPTDIATSDRGEIAIADPKAGGVIFIGTDDRPTLRRWTNVHSPSRVRFDGRRFVIVDQAARAAFDASVDKPEPDAHPLPLTTVPGDRGAIEAPFIHSLSVAQGTRYFASNTEVLVLPLGDRRPFRWVPNVMAEREALPGPLIVRAWDDRFVIAQPQAPALHVVRRVMPADFTFAMDPRMSGGALVATYRYLYERHLLSIAPLTPTSSATTLQQWLIEQHVLLGPLEPSKQAAADFVKLLCALNPALCTQRSALTLDRKTDPRTAVLLPGIAFTPIVSGDTVTLKGKSADAYVNEQFRNYRASGAIGSEQVWQMNSASRSLEAEFGRQGFTLATPPSPDLAPGSVITYRNGVEQVVTRSGCGLPAASRDSTPWFVPDWLQASDGRAYLPPAVVTPAPTRATELTYVRTTLETVRASDALAQACGSLPGNAYLITAAVRVEGIRARDAMANRARSQQAPIEIDQPLYIAYTAVPLSQAGQPALEPVDPAVVKPNAAQNVFRKTTGELNLPVVRWRAAALVDVREYRDKTSALNRLQDQFPGLAIISTESLAVTQQALDDQPDPVAALRSLLHAERRGVLQAIDYDDSLSVSDAVVFVGIGEAPETVSMGHPGFLDKDQKNAWWTLNASGGLSQFTGAAATDPPSLLEGSPPDHGTHVGGIIGARRNSLLPGLLPASRLVLIAPGQNAALHHTIDAARLRNVNVFNFSFSVKATAQDPGLSKLKGRIGSDFANALFVVAAGNKGNDLTTAGELEAPISWVPDAPDNMLGVAAAVSVDEARGRSWQVHSDSNFGKRYVQLAAPGDRVVSLSAPASYRHATGTSEAAPQVAAAAAMLIAQRHDASPRAVKARLLYTASWYPDFERRPVWAGLLNVRRAVTNLDYDVVARLTAPHIYYGLQVQGNPEILVEDTEIDKLDTPRPIEVAQFSLPFEQILRIEYQSSLKRWRVFFLILENGNWHLRIANHAILSGTLSCNSLDVIDNVNKRVDKAPLSDAVCGPGLDVSQIANFVANIDRLPRTFGFN